MKKELLLSKNDIEQLRKYKFIKGNEKRKNVDKSFSIHQKFVDNIPDLLQDEINKHLSDIKVRSSVGEGKMSEVYWIVFGNKNLLSKNKLGNLKTQSGIYIALLFDDDLNKVYVAIANGAEELNGQALTDLSNNQMDVLNDIDHTGFVQNRKFDIYLGPSGRPKKYVKGIPLYKSYNIENIEVKELIEDVIQLENILETIVMEKGVEEVGGKSQRDPKKRSYTTISVEKYAILRGLQEERNKQIGELAEQFIYNKEVETVTKSYALSSDEVKWVGKDTDGLGYDIESVFKDGTRKYIEVKGTSLDTSKVTFYLSKNELEVSEFYGPNYVLVLVANVNEKSKTKIIQEIVNPASNIFKTLEPIQYKGLYKK